MPLRAVDTVWAQRCYMQGRPDWQQRLHFERMAWAPERPKRGPVVPISWWQVLKSLFFPPR
jgi:hypothetical protein